MPKKRVSFGDRNLDMSSEYDRMFGKDIRSENPKNDENTQEKPDKSVPTKESELADKEGKSSIPESESESKEDNDANSDTGKEPRLQMFSKIKDYYRGYPGGKQYSIYLPEEIQKKVKVQAINDDKSVSDILRELIIDYGLSDSVIKDAYNREYDKRNKNN